MPPSLRRLISTDSSRMWHVTSSHSLSAALKPPGSWLREARRPQPGQPKLPHPPTSPGFQAKKRGGQLRDASTHQKVRYLLPTGLISLSLEHKKAQETTTDLRHCLARRRLVSQLIQFRAQYPLSITNPRGFKLSFQITRQDATPESPPNRRGDAVRRQRRL
jgi:hypothetical protein